LQLAQTQYFDKIKAPRVGKLLGAARVVSGNISQPEGDKLKLESGIIGVKDGFVEYPDDVQGDMKQFFVLEKQLATNILELLGYTLTEEEKKKFMELPTESFLAFLSYSQGLEYMDQGMYTLADAQFENALKEDPGFGLARMAKSEAEGLYDYTGEIEPAASLENAIQVETATGAAQPEGGLQILELRDVLGFQPDASTDAGDNPHTDPVVGTGHVTIIGIFDEP